MRSTRRYGVTRDARPQTAVGAGAGIVEVEIVCTDQAEHCRRIESRDSDVSASMSAIALGFADEPRRRWRARDDVGMAPFVVRTGVIWSGHSRL